MRINLRHVIFWIAIYFAWTYMKSGRVMSPTYLIVNLVNVPIYMAAFYFLTNFQIPKLFKKGRIVAFILSLLATSILFYTIWRLLGLWWIDDLRGFKHKFLGSFADFLTQSVQFYSPAMALLVWDSFYERRKEQEKILKLEKEKLSTELKFLKAQLNPHFLFNTLNNLYSFVINGSPKAPSIILGLSGMLDYILYKSQEESVLLSEEIEAIENFIELEQIRYGERLTVNFNKKGDFSVLISPLLLLSLVENAFKHGASGDIFNPEINIRIEASQELILCIVENSKSTYKGEINDSYKEGIGLSNVQRQLDLVYTEHHTLEIDEQHDSYSVILKVTLKNG